MANVKVVLCKVGLVGIAKRLSSLDPQIPLVHVADARELFNDGVQHAAIRNDDVKVDTGLGGHSLDRGAAHVLDTERKITKGLRNFALDRFKSDVLRAVKGEDDNLGRLHKITCFLISLSLLYHVFVDLSSAHVASLSPFGLQKKVKKE